MAIRFLGLDAEQRQRLRRTLSGDENNPIFERALVPAAVTGIYTGGADTRALRRPSTPATRRPVIPHNAPVFLLTDEPSAPEHPKETSGGVLVDMRSTIQELEAQLMELGKKNGALLDENSRLKRETMSLQARLSVTTSLRDRVVEELTEAEETVEELLRGEDSFIRRIQSLETILRTRRR